MLVAVFDTVFKRAAAWSSGNASDDHALVNVLLQGRDTPPTLAGIEVQLLVTLTQFDLE
ncbi:hypothetical protein [Nocardioides sp. NPDC006273]|uniref:hypothetical protein n=1 Tax=Nocardioides sp. NPDC006273 TaxID=3155598 RepID=UPI0033A305A2